MRINENFELIQPDDDDRNLVNGLGLFYHYDEVENLIMQLEHARSIEAEGYIVAQALGDTAFQAYYQDTIGQITDIIDNVVPIAAQTLIIETEQFLLSHSA